MSRLPLADIRVVDISTVLAGPNFARYLGDYGADVMQLLYVANRYECKGEIVRAREAGTILVCDRHMASSVAYGEAFGLGRIKQTSVFELRPPAFVRCGYIMLRQEPTQWYGSTLIEQD